MNKLAIEQFKVKLQKRFPLIVIKDGTEFSNELVTNKPSIWLPNAVDVSYTNKDKSTLYQYHKPTAYVKFIKWCNRYGWYPNTIDYTMLIFQIE